MEIKSTREATYHPTGQIGTTTGKEAQHNWRTVHESSEKVATQQGLKLLEMTFWKVELGTAKDGEA